MKSIAQKIISLLMIALLCASNIAYAQTPADATSSPADTAPEAATSSPSPEVAVAAPIAPDAAISESTDTPTVPDPIIATSSASADDSSDVAAPVASTTESAAADVQGSSASVQDAVTTQPAVTGGVLEVTSNPQEATTTDVAQAPAEDASSTVASIPQIDTATDAATDTVQAIPDTATTTSLDVVDQIDNTPPAPVPAVDTTQTSHESAPAQDTAAEFVVAPPEPQFTFALTGKHVAAKKIVKDKNGQPVGQQDVTATLTPQIDNATGDFSVSGQCSDKYFVILLFKNEDDYANDPRSYVINRAYPCTSGSFSYSVSDLPASLPNGTYYLLVGQQGDTGTWTPITSLTEITINRAQ